MTLLPVVEILPLKLDGPNAVRYAIRRHLPSAHFKNVKDVAGLSSDAGADLGQASKPKRSREAAATRPKAQKESRHDKRQKEHEGAVVLQLDMTQRDADARLQELSEASTRLQAERAQLVARIELTNHYVECYKRKISKLV